MNNLCVVFALLTFCKNRPASLEPLQNVKVCNVMHPFDPITFRIEPLLAAAVTKVALPPQDTPAALPEADDSVPLLDKAMQVADLASQQVINGELIDFY